MSLSESSTEKLKILEKSKIEFAESSSETTSATNQTLKHDVLARLSLRQTRETLRIVLESKHGGESQDDDATP